MIEEHEQNFATVGAVFFDGVTLLFDGETEAGEKHYKCNTSAPIAAGDRVRIIKDSGTYVVEYAVGAPNTRAIPSGGSSGQVLMKNGPTPYKLMFGSAPVGDMLSTTYHSLKLVDNSSNLAHLDASRDRTIDLGSSSKSLRYVYAERVYICYNSYTQGYLTCNSAGKLCWNGTPIT